MGIAARLSPETYAGIEQAVTSNILGKTPAGLTSIFGAGNDLNTIAQGLTLKGTGINTSQELNY